MPNTNKTEAQLQKELLETVQEVGELLKKSGLAKAEGEDEVGDVQPEHTEPDADQAGGPSDQDADNMPPPVESGEGDVPPPAEGAEGAEGGDEASEMAAHAAELSDEELQSMLEVLMAEVEKRHAGAQGAQGEQAGAPPAAAPAAEPQEPMAASMKKEFSALAKSVAEIAEAVKNITGEVGVLKKSVSDKRQNTVVSRPAAANKNVQVLQKSNEAKEKLSKSDTLNYLLSEQRGGNKKVNSDMIATVNACQSDEDLSTAQKNIEKLGIKLP